MRDLIKCREFKHIDLSRAGHGPLVATRNISS